MKMNPMRVTAVALMVLGLLLAGYAAVSLSPTGTATGSVDDAPTPGSPLAVILFPFAGIAVAAGIAMYLFGGRGVIQTRNPAVRN
jgi:hypothetical protein